MKSQFESMKIRIQFPFPILKPPNDKNFIGQVQIQMKELKKMQYTCGITDSKTASPMVEWLRSPPPTRRTWILFSVSENEFFKHYSSIILFIFLIIAYLMNILSIILSRVNVLAADFTICAMKFLPSQHKRTN